MNERIPLLVEGIDTTDGWYILPGAIHWPDEPLPIIEYVDGESHIIGTVTDIRREGNLITGVVDVEGNPSTVLQP
jgi:hypothetical protein